jgi:hypothetical protein
MANNPNKLTDPADETLTAIQQVLSVSDEPTQARANEPAEPKTPSQPQAEPAPQPHSATVSQPRYEPENRADPFLSVPEAPRDAFGADRGSGQANSLSAKSASRSVRSCARLNSVHRNLPM